MHLFRTQAERNRQNITWIQEYVLGLVSCYSPLSNNEMIKKATGTLSAATTHKYITQLVERGLVSQAVNKEDRRYANLCITKKGIEVLDAIDSGELDDADE